jgi:hypothetical protein
MIVQYYEFTFLQCNITFLNSVKSFWVILSTDIASQITSHFGLKK